MNIQFSLRKFARQIHSSQLKLMEKLLLSLTWILLLALLATQVVSAAGGSGGGGGITHLMM